MSSILKANGHKTSLINIDTLNPEDIMNAVKKEKPDMIGITSVSSQFPHVKHIVKTIKQNEDIFCVIGGVHPTLMPECINDIQADALVRSEGEYPMLELAKALESGKDHTKIKNVWARHKGKIIRNPVRPLIDDLDSLPFPDREILDYQEMINKLGRAKFMFIRGCPFKCTYCSNHALSGLYKTGNYLRHRSPKNCIDEIREVTSNYRNIKTIVIGADTINANKKWLFDLLERYKKEFKIPFRTIMRANLCDRETFRRLKEAGCDEVFLGIESGNEYIRNTVMNRNMTTQQIKDAFKWAKEYGIKTLGNNIIGLPFETEDMIKDTIKLNAEIDPNLIGLGIFYPYEGTELGDMCRREGLIRDDIDLGNFKEREDSILNLPTISRKKILWYYKNFHYLVYKQKNPKKAMYYKLTSYKSIRKGIGVAKKHLPLSARRKIKKLVGDVNY
jgi:radical SAM superfamily enzyme YgiQ (UPF0313 family)